MPSWTVNKMTLTNLLPFKFATQVGPTWGIQGHITLYPDPEENISFSFLRLVDSSLLLFINLTEAVRSAKFKVSYCNDDHWLQLDALHFMQTLQNENKRMNLSLWWVTNSELIWFFILKRHSPVCRQDGWRIQQIMNSSQNCVLYIFFSVVFSSASLP